MCKSMPAINYGQLLPYTESLANIVTIHEPQFNTPIWLEIPRADAKDLTIYQIKELGLNPTEIDIQSVTRDGIRPWVAIEASVLGLNKNLDIVHPHERAGHLILREMLKGGNFGHQYNYKGKSAFSCFAQQIVYNLRYIFEFPSEPISRPFSLVWDYIKKRTV